ncbi:pseudouridine synthase [Pleomorphochaeta sp. DL1XJH-081]|jgi:23S rRNA pseudouridine1911/1915/1917 synthase|uniref:pseudouridine synthase n=1 Tax=Pleomorphochaeta sp. DL1XJH-081 TaxID=3409690 RepID=UPI003BB586BD
MQIPQCRVLYESDSFLIVEKPSFLATVPLSRDPLGHSLLNQLLSTYPEVGEGSGRQSHEGLVLHRLDTDTCGLVLVARDAFSFQKLQLAQNNGFFTKTYLAVVSKSFRLDGFPSDKPDLPIGHRVIIESRFRPYGIGRRAVRPVAEESSRLAKQKGGAAMYYTSVEHMGKDGLGRHLVKCRLVKGFRHQIRSHLAWTSYPIIGDRLYGGEVADELHLAAVTLEFPHPSDGSPFKFDWNEAPEWTQQSAYGEVEDE